MFSLQLHFVQNYRFMFGLELMFSLQLRFVFYLELMLTLHLRFIFCYTLFRVNESLSFAFCLQLELRFVSSLQLHFVLN